MKLKENMYVRTKQGFISKFKEEDTLFGCTYLYFETSIWEDSYIPSCRVKKERFMNRYFLKESYDILDLLEPMDLMYVDVSPDDCGGIVVPRIAETIRELEKYKELIRDGSYILKEIVCHGQLKGYEL